MTSSKRPPPGFKAPPTPTINGASTNINGVQPRLSQRRKDSQKPGDLQFRARNGKDGERRNVKRRPEPHVKTAGYLLKKYRGHQPSLIIHLHPTNFRFDQQDGSFPYNSPMKVVLQHLKAQTVPHDMIDELMNAGVKFYENCLIVQVKDHRRGKTKDSFSASETKGSNVPASAHNYEQWVTPSPYAPYPEQKSPKVGNKDLSEAQDPEKTTASNDQDISKEPDTYTVVLFPTPLSMQEEAFVQVSTSDFRPGNRRTPGVNVPRTPASATATVPPTPLSAIPSTPSLSGPPNKRLKMSITAAEIQGFESKLIAATAPPLFLEPVEDLREAHNLLENLTDPLHREKLPFPKTRRRTVAELAADERIAAQEQAFMLIMDEKAGPNVAKAASNDEASATSFQPRFESFNAIQQIKAQHEEQMRLLALQKHRHEVEMKQRETQAKQQRERSAQQDRNEKEQKAQLAAQQNNQLRFMQHKDRATLLRQQQQALATQNQTTHAQANGVIPNGLSQPQHSSPIMRNSTPHSNASPVVGNRIVSQAGGVAMQATSSGHGSSPGRPPSSMQHGHPNAGGIAMVHQRSRQQHPSRTGTPQMIGTPHMANTTPNMSHTTPIMGMVTPTSHMAQGSPAHVMHTPSMQNPGPNQRVNGVNQMTQEHYQEMLRHGQQQQAFHNQQQQMMQQQRHQQQAHQMKNSPNLQMSPNGPQMPNLQHLAAVQRRQQDAAYMQKLQNQNTASMTGTHGHPNMLNGASPHLSQQQTPNPNQQPGQPRPIAQTPSATAHSRHEQIYREQFSRINAQLLAQYGGNPSLIPHQQKEEAKRQAIRMTQELINRHKAEMQNKSLLERQNQQMMQKMQQMQQMQNMRQQGQGIAGQHQNGQPQGPGIGSGPGMQHAMGFLGQGQGLTREQMMAQMGQMGHLGPGGVNGMNGMNGMGGMQ
ncbi:MAG: hypothetical protein Q9164_004625 [Protoblastenia rupestris]